MKEIEKREVLGSGHWIYWTTEAASSSLLAIMIINVKKHFECLWDKILKCFGRFQTCDTIPCTHRRVDFIRRQTLRSRKRDSTCVIPGCIFRRDDIVLTSAHNYCYFIDYSVGGNLADVSDVRVITHWRLASKIWSPNYSKCVSVWWELFERF